MIDKTSASQQELLTLVTQQMPFGKYKGRTLCDLPVSYIEWFAKKGFPPGKLGTQLALLHTIKTNGLDEILYKLRHLNAITKSNL
jgi:uncharacterized protein (DUF3820 family)